MLTLGNKLTLNSQPIYHFVNKYSIDFDGVDDCIITDGADTVLQNTTYSFWCKTSESSSNTVFGHGSVTKGAFSLNYLSDKPLLGFSSNTYVYWQDVTAQDDGEWHHWVVYADATTIGNCKLYIDGVLQTQTNAVNNTGYDAYTESLTIGGSQVSGGSYFNGKIDEFAVYDRELTQAEITRMYNTYYSPNRVANGNFSQIGNEEVTNGDFSQIGSEQITNGDFSNGENNWSFGTGWSIIDGKATVVNQTGWLTTTGAPILANKQIKLQFNVVLDGGTLRVKNNTNDFDETFNTVGSYTITRYYSTGGSASNLQFPNYGSGFSGSIDNVSVKEVGQDWTIEDVWTIGDSVANGNGANGSSEQLVQNSVTTIGKIYKVSYEILNYVSGSVFLPNVGSIQSGNGIYTEYITATQTDLKVTGTNFNGSITNITIKEVGQHWTFGTGWSTDGTKAIFDDVNDGTYISQSLTLNSSTSYKFNITISDGSGARIQLTDNTGVGLYDFYSEGNLANGNYEVVFNTSSSASGIRIYGYTLSDSSFSVDNIVLQELKHDATNLMLNAGAYQSANPLITSTKSMEFDGTDDYLSIGSDCPTGNFTVTSWVKKTGTGGWYAIFSAGTQIWFGLNNNGQILAHVGGPSFSTTGAVDINKWHNCTLTWNGTASFIYVDGVQVATSTGTSNPAATPYDIGKLSTSGQNYFDGLITEVGLYDRALTSLEVASLYNQGMPTNLLVNRNNYQSGNPTVFNTKQVDFDGVDDVLNIGNSSVLNFTSDFTISMWIKSNINTDSYNGLFTKYGGSEGWDFFLASGRLGMGLRGSSSIVTGTSGLSDLRDNEWHHIVAVNTNSDIKLYLDGSLINTTTGTWTPTTTTEDALIGQRSGISNFDGDISQVGAWTGTLTADEVSSLYNHGLPIDLTTNQAAYESSSNLVSYWRMGSGTLDSYPLIADQTNATLGSELITNGDFANGTTGWTVTGSGTASIVDNALNYSNTVNGSWFAQFISQAVSFVQNKIYKVTFKAKNISGSVNLRITHQSHIIFNNNLTSSFVDYTVYYTAQANNDSIRIFCNDAIGEFQIDNVSIKQVNGNPAIMTNQTSSDIENGSPYANIVQNGDFATGDFTSWANNTSGNASIVNNQCVFTNASSGNNIQQTPPIVIGKTYISTFDIISITQGAFKIYADSGSGKSDVGKYSFTWTATDTNWYVRAAGTTSGVIDNVTVEEVNTGLQGYWKMGDGTNDEYPVIYDQTNPTNGSELSSDTNFSSPSSWNTGTNTTITNNKATLTVTGGGLQYATNIGLDVVNTKTYKFVFTANRTSGTGNIVFGYDSGNSVSDSPQISTSGTQTIYFKPTYNTPNLGFKSYTGSGDYIWEISDFSVKEVNGNYATMTNMVEGNITNQYPLTKIRNYYRMGDGILDGYPIIQDQTSPNLAHIPTTNLIIYSEDFSQSNWVKNNVSITSNSTISPDGTQNADTLTEDTSNSTHFIQIQSITTTVNIYSFSAYFKANGKNIVRIMGSNYFSSGTDGIFNLQTETFVLGIRATNGKIENVGNDWYRCSFTASENGFAGNNAHYRIYLGDGGTYTGDGVSGVFVYGAEMEQQHQATAYIKSDGIAAVRKSSTTNLVNYSEDFTQSDWTKTGSAVVTPNTTISPDGTQNADTLNIPSGSFFFTSITTGAGTFTLSCYVKVSSGTLDFKMQSFNGTDGANVSSTFIATTNWQRFEFTSTVTVNSNFYPIQISGLTGGNFEIWGTQVEEQTQAETYAKTTGLPVEIDLFTENNYGTMTNMSASDIIEDTPNN